MEWRTGLNDNNKYQIWYGLKTDVNDIQLTQTTNANGTNYIKDVIRLDPGVGIGINGDAVDYPLRIYGNSHDGFGVLSTASIATANGFYSITGGWMSSDERIKDNIEDVPDNLALQMVKDIPCRYYTYKDYKKRGKDKTIGFIAQDVQKVLPMAVEKHKRFLPNVYKELSGTWNEYIFTPTNIELQNGVMYQFTLNENTEEVKCVNGSFTFEQKNTTVFCVGSQVDDFHVLNKDKIFTLHHSAIQELVKQIETLTARVRQLEQK